MAFVNIWLYYKEKLTRARIVLKGSLVRIPHAVSGLPPPTMARHGPPEQFCVLRGWVLSLWLR